MRGRKKKFAFEGGVIMQKNYAEVLESDGEEETPRIRFYETKEKEELLPVEHNMPAYDKEKEIVGVTGYEVQKDKVVVKYRKERKPQRRQTLDDFADMIAKKVEGRLQS